MRDRKSLTKSLHTVTIVTKVALILRENVGANVQTKTLVSMALEAIGQPGVSHWGEEDATVAACIAAVNKQLGRK